MNVNATRPLPPYQLQGQISCSEARIKILQDSQELGKFIISSCYLGYRRQVVPLFKIVKYYFPQGLLQDSYLFIVIDSLLFDTVRVCYHTWMIFQKSRGFAKLEKLTQAAQLPRSEFYETALEEYQLERKVYRSRMIGFFIKRMIPLPFLFECLPIAKSTNDNILICISWASVITVIYANFLTFRKKWTAYKHFVSSSQECLALIQEDKDFIGQRPQLVTFLNLVELKSSQSNSIRYEMMKSAFKCTVCAVDFFLKVTPVVIGNSLILSRIKMGFSAFSVHTGVVIMLLGIAIFCKEHLKSCLDFTTEFRVRKARLRVDNLDYRAKFLQLSQGNFEKCKELIKEKRAAMQTSSSLEERRTNQYFTDFALYQNRIAEVEQLLTALPSLDVRDRNVLALLDRYEIDVSPGNSLEKQIRTLLAEDPQKFIDRCLRIQEQRAGPAPA